MLLFNISFGAALAALHVLRMAGIDNGDGVAIAGVGEVPLVGVGHVESCPTAQSWLAAQESVLNTEHRINGIIDILVHQLFGVGMPVFFCDIVVERGYLSTRKWPDFIPVHHHASA